MKGKIQKHANLSKWRDFSPHVTQFPKSYSEEKPMALFRPTGLTQPSYRVGCVKGTAM